MEHQIGIIWKIKKETNRRQNRKHDADEKKIVKSIMGVIYTPLYTIMEGLILIEGRLVGRKIYNGNKNGIECKG